MKTRPAIAHRRTSFARGLLLTLSVLLVSSATNLMAFALFGPYADWMDRTNSYRMGWDVGGPVDITQGYRWNVPVVTYGFDQSFIDYFGSNGVYAVEQAFQALNNLPPASQIVVTNYPAFGLSENFQASAQLLYDLKTATLALLVEQLGLAEPDRSIFVLRQWSPSFILFDSEQSWPDWVIPGYIVERNYDPVSFAISHYVNADLFTGQVVTLGPLDPNPQVAWVQPMLVDPVGPYPNAIAEWREYFHPLFGVNDGSTPGIFAGYLYFSFTRDDVGGLHYLLSTNNINLETLLPDVHGAGPDALSYVNIAPRPGIDKVTFAPQPYDPPLTRFLPLTNQWTDTFLTNGTVQHQQLERITTAPDFLFSAIDTSDTNSDAPFFVRTGAENWWNSAASAGASGPGVIRPPIQIAFSKLGSSVDTSEVSTNIYTTVYQFHWASFDNSTNPIIVYPQPEFTGPTNSLTIHQWLYDANAPNLWTNKDIKWVAPVPRGARALLQTSTNLADWITLTSVTNQGVGITWRHFYSLPERYFRVLSR